MATRNIIFVDQEQLIPGVVEKSEPGRCLVRTGGGKIIAQTTRKYKAGDNVLVARVGNSFSVISGKSQTKSGKVKVIRIPG